jgi:hypothetical protein
MLQSFFHYFKVLPKRLRLGMFVLLFVFPASENYSLNSFGFGAGGETSESDHYAAEYILGETSDTQLSGANYNAWPGLIYTQFANTPTISISNDENYYNKLNIIIDPQNNPSNAKFAIAISDDGFTTTQYVQSDNTIGPTLGSEDWQSYADWGAATGEFVVGLEPGTTYTVKAKAERGDFTEGPWGPEDSAATVESTLTFDIDVSSSDSESSAPYTVAMGSLSPGSVSTAEDKIWVDLTTNASGGGQVFIVGEGAGLTSAATGYTISSVTGDLSALSEGFGVRSDSVTQSSGGPFAPVSPFDGSDDNVGEVTTTFTEIFNTSSAPIVGGRASAVVKAKSKSLTPAANDYTETFTLVAIGIF